MLVKLVTLTSLFVGRAQCHTNVTMLVKLVTLTSLFVGRAQCHTNVTMLVKLVTLTSLFVGWAQCHTNVAPIPGDMETELTQRGGFTQILSLLRTSGHLDTLKNADNITLFAPTDSALTRVFGDQLTSLTSNTTLLASTLDYHIILADVKCLHRANIDQLQDEIFTSSNGMPIRFNVYSVVHSITAEGVNITERAIPVSNGYVHALDGIMIPPAGDVVDLAVASGQFKTLVSLLQTAGLVDAIRSELNITVFAPTDNAFAKLEPNMMSYLLSHTSKLENVLLYHVVKSITLYSVGMRHSMTFPTADKGHDNVMVLEDFATGDIMVNTAKIIGKDISATNGVVHVIDEVLIPARVLLHMQDHRVIG